jgi:hypothetical protein
LRLLCRQHTAILDDIPEDIDAAKVKRYRVSKGFLCAFASLREKISTAEGTFRARPLEPLLALNEVDSLQNAVYYSCCVTGRNPSAERAEPT